ncbi:hypothetical protein CHLRE_11g469400v5 [Chlamydomonas reinhardtii]|mgnify:CR=1 FL=1|uniref:Response regulatory domain-containing protein n=1 Tax=Chlamydomonas reinhardtii TaxID=3055 RepID=A8JC57_CHLRE|nr:uncharacterized protein CHLRE_11g469400v5 [Chlamydomonas reinhardtii]PNW76740.1 hypothetical protein CHLRE_11g469400v5 [Chlamydomonas reinhardtii]|eukprot:XP_001699552.1 predicted protein [Chlamydomonas reinhardtii]
MGKPLHFDVHGQLRVLAVDDDSVNLMVIESVLKPMGWDIVPAIDGSEAYAACDNEPEWPDIVLLDYNLEVGDSGETVLANLRSRFAGFNVPIVMCTAMSANSAELDRCLKNGAVDILLKPYERSRVMDIVEKHCPGKAAPAAKPAAALPPPAPAAAPAPAPAPTAAPPPPAAAGPAAADVESFCVSIGLDYLGKKLKEQGVSLSDLKGFDDAALRKMGVVVKSQRDKILDAAKNC